MKDPNLAAFTAVGLTIGLLSGDTAPAQTQPINLRQEAAAARLAIATRYQTCAITGLVDHHETKTQPLLLGNDTSPRDKVYLTFKVAETPDALHYEQLYAKDSTVTWFPAGPLARQRTTDQQGVTSFGKQIPGPDILKSQGNATSLTLPIFPRPDINYGSVAIFVTGYSETNDFAAGRKSWAYGAKYCGTIALKVSAATDTGQSSWQIEPNALPANDITRQSDCPLVSDPGNHNIYYSSC